MTKKLLNVKLLTQAQLDEYYASVAREYYAIAALNDDFDLDPDDYDDPNDYLPSDHCEICGQPMLDDIEVGQGFCITAPCWMYATGQIQLVIEGERQQQTERERQIRQNPAPQSS